MKMVHYPSTKAGFFGMNKKGILFTVTTLLLLLSIFTLASTFLERTQELQKDSGIRIEAEQITYAENDIVGNVYWEMLTTNIYSIERGTSLTMKLNSTQLSESLDHLANMQRYKRFIEENYSLSNNLNITLIGFNNSFKIKPYNAIFLIDKNTLHIYTGHMNLESLRINMSVSRNNDTKFESSTPQGGGGQRIPVSVSYYDYEGDLVYEESMETSAIRDNDNAQGRQFYQSFQEGDAPAYVAHIETKFGDVNGTPTEIYIFTQNMTANITSLELQFVLPTSPVLVTGGNITITSKVGGIKKNSEIILLEE
jgi:hypothetical protein